MRYLLWNIYLLIRLLKVARLFEIHDGYLKNIGGGKSQLDNMGV